MAHSGATFRSRDMAWKPGLHRSPFYPAGTCVTLVRERKKGAWKAAPFSASAEQRGDFQVSFLRPPRLIFQADREALRSDTQRLAAW